MEPIRFLTLDEVLELHAEQLDLYGGLEGVLNPACSKRPSPGRCSLSPAST